jgi:hypothetical protein
MKMAMKYELFKRAKSLDEFKALVLMNTQYGRYVHKTALQEFLCELNEEMCWEEYSYLQAVSFMLANPSIYFDRDVLVKRLHRKMESYYGDCMSEEFPEYDEDELEAVAA